jgi:hypothetical protein
MLPWGRKKGKQGRRGKRKEKEKGKRERNKKRSYEVVTIHCNDDLKLNWIVAQLCFVILSQVCVASSKGISSCRPISIAAAGL